MVHVNTASSQMYMYQQVHGTCTISSHMYMYQLEHGARITISTYMHMY